MEQELKRGGFFTLVGAAAGFPWRGPPGNTTATGGAAHPARLSGWRRPQSCGHPLSSRSAGAIYELNFRRFRLATRSTEIALRRRGGFAFPEGRAPFFLIDTRFPIQYSYYVYL